MEHPMNLLRKRDHAHCLKQDRKEFFEKYSPEARKILNELLEKYVQHGAFQVAGRPGRAADHLGPRPAMSDLPGVRGLGGSYEQF
jgi:hypothetical protein